MILNVCEAVDKHLVWSAKNSFRDNTHFHPSSWDGCKRAIAYSYYEAMGFINIDVNAAKVDPQLQRIFSNGHSMHDRWRSYLENIGVMLGRWQCANWMAHKKPVIYGLDSKLGCSKPQSCICGSERFIYHEISFFDEHTMFGGHVDTIIDQHALARAIGSNASIANEECYVIVDFKSMNSFEFKSLESPKSEHYTQMQIYLYLAGLKYGKFIYEDKNNQSVKEYLVVFDPVFFEVKKAEALSLKYLITTPSETGKHRLPVRGYSSRAHPNCQKCKYRGHCWSEKHEQDKIIKQQVALKPVEIGICDV